MLKKIGILLLFAFVMQSISAQKKIVFEKIRSLSFNKPVKDYLQNAAVKKAIEEDLNTTLLKTQLIPLLTTKPAQVSFIPYGAQVQEVKPDFTDADTSHLHLYLDIFETSPGSFFTLPDNYPPDSALVKRAATILLFRATVFNANRSVFLKEVLNIVVSEAETPGIGNRFGGIRYADLSIVPNAFIKLIKAGTNMLFDPKNDLATVEIKVQPAYMTDNYLLPKTLDQPRIYVQNKKSISSFSRNGKPELIRMSEPVYEEIVLKGRNAQKYPELITNAIKQTMHASASDYVFLRQDCRDVVRDKNYLLKLIVQVDHSNLPEDQSLLLTNFLTGNIHYLFSENDTIAKFSIEQRIPSDSNKVFVNIMSNGYDTSSFYQTNPGVQTAPWDVVYDYVVKGSIGKQSFRIKCSGTRNTIKEIFVDDKLVCIAQGKFSPEKFVLFDASLSPELLNPLFMIGFNRFFE